MKYNNRQWCVLVCLAACALSATAQTGKGVTGSAATEKGAHFLGKLPASEMQSIQGLGRTVLAAQQSATPDPTQETLRNDLIAMSAALDQALAAIVKTPPQLHGAGRTLKAIPATTAQTLRPDATSPDVTNLEYRVSIGPDGQITQQAAPPLPVANPILEAPTLRSQAPQETVAEIDHLATVRGMLATAKQHAAEMTAGTQPTDEVQKAHNVRLLSKSKELHQELEAMMSATGTGDTAKLAQLRERLHSKNLREMFAEREGSSALKPTPTISTITHHR